jgi:transcriptional repressor NrdR
MKCPFCLEENSKVIDSRTFSEGRAIRRRRECMSCTKRFTTYETIEVIGIKVVKKDGRREEFNKEKVMKGLIRAVEKRNIPLEKLENISLDIEKDAQDNLKGEITSEQIGKIIMKKLLEVDEIAYVRFASVYKDFKDLESFIKEIEAMKNE